tara:strand:- start:606 stop:926 length:321 start_codon:yes stop_codon:yes gene_type:complete
MVKKVLANGESCKKCADVERRLKQDNHWSKLDEIVIAKENDPNSDGMQIAKHHGIDVAPFFIVEENGKVELYTLYFKFVNEVLKGHPSKTETNLEILENNPDLDLL